LAYPVDDGKAQSTSDRQLPATSTLLLKR